MSGNVITRGGPRDLLEARVDAFMAGAHTLTPALWDSLATRAPDGPAVRELISAARVADGGKFLRPRLVAAAYFAYGGTDIGLLGTVAAAQQLLHVGLCIHDDLIDDDRMRHGRATVSASIEDGALRDGVDPARARRRGQASGILAGDLAISTALTTLLSADCAPDVRVELVSASLAALEAAIEGEALDVWDETVDPLLTHPLHTAALKTASYSVALPLVLGAIASGGATAGDIQTLRELAVPLGVAYQLHDDELGLFGHPSTTGKSASDIRDGKRTEHLRLAVQLADSAQRAALLSLVGRADLNELEADRVREIVRATGARAAVRQTIDQLLAHCRETADSKLPHALSNHLATLIVGLDQRER